MLCIGDFSALTACEGQRVELRCPRAQFIAIRSAVFGWSNSFHRQSDCVHRRLPSAADHGLYCLWRVLPHLRFFAVSIYPAAG